MIYEPSSPKAAHTFSKKLPRLLRLLAAILALNVLCYVLLRLSFWAIFYPSHQTAPTDVLLYSFYLGLKFDLRLALLISLPLLLLGWIKWLSPFYSRWHGLLWIAYFTLAQMLIMLLYAADFGYYAYLQARLDATSLYFLQDMVISLKMIWQTYPVIWISLAIFLFIAGYSWSAKRLFTRITRRSSLPLRKRHLAWIAPSSFFIALFGIYGKFSFYPLRWSDAFFSTHPFASSAALNPALYFFDTLKNKDSNFDIQQTRHHYPRIAEYLGVKHADTQTLNFIRHEISHHHFAQAPNIVMVFLESFAAAKTGAYGNPLKPTPHFDTLARRGLLFNNFYTPHINTSRSVFAAVTGIPDIEVNQSSSRNPLVVKQNTLVNEFKGYDKFYFLGGSANWGNIRGILSGNIPGLMLHEEGSYSRDSQRIDVWGISDLHLFIEANRVLRKPRDKPFFAMIQTASNHRPYKLPDDRMGFEYDSKDNFDWKKYGFHNEREYNALRFLDHSIGKFIEIAQQEAYFKNTLFAFFGDHAVPEVGEHMPQYLQQLHIHEELVPFVIYAPALIGKGRIHSKIASELDVLPTLAGLSLPQYTNTTLGRDLLDPRHDSQRYAFTFNRTPEIGLIGDKFYFQMFANGQHKRLHRLDSHNPRKNVVDHHPDIARQFEELCRGIYETARYMRFNQSPLKNGTAVLAQQKRNKNSHKD